MKKYMTYHEKVMRFFLIGAISFLIIIITAISVVIAERSQKRPLPSLPELQSNQSVWIQLIKEESPEYTYAIYKKENEAINNYDKQHEYAHAMGSLLYSTLGEKGIRICDDSYNYGCYHSFFGRAMSANGEKIMPVLYNECLKVKTNNGGCLHGIGHSVMYYLGRKKLPEALSTCSSLLKKVPSFLCTSGVFMEYNMNTMNNPSGDKRFVRPYSGNSFAPCNSVNTEFQPACYFSLPQWWSLVLASPPEYTKFGELCSQVRDSKNKLSCYFGIGAIGASEVHYSVSQTRILCDKMPDLNSEIACRAGAAHKLLSTGKLYAQHAYELCEDLEPSERQVCNEDIEILSNNRL